MVEEGTVNIIEVVCLGVDAVLFSLFYKLYLNNKRVTEAIKAAPVINLDSDLTNNLTTNLRNSTTRSLPYAIIKGTAKAVKQPLQSYSNPLITGVIQQIIRKEHQVKWNWATRWWLETEKEVSSTKNYVPFIIKGPLSGFHVHVSEPLRANILELTTISDQFEPSQSGLGEAIWGFFTGARTKGFQTVEQMLLEGASVTGIGQIILNKEGEVGLYPPGKGLQYYLTQLSEVTLLRSLDAETSLFKIISTICGVIGLYFMYGILAKSFNQFKKRRAVQQRKQLLQELRDRSRNQLNTSNQSPPCVICMSNPREVVILDCGHVCCCADCAENLTSACPICRGPIARFWPAYIS